MKVNKKKIFKILISFILLIIFINFLIHMGFKNNKKQDDFLFLKLFSDAYFSKGTASNEGMLISTNENSKIQNEKVYKFRIDYKNLQFKSINLSETIDRNTMVNEKIAPGTSGNFDILIESNQDLKYKVEFNSLNQKPKNLKFKAYKNEKFIGEENTLEKLSNIMQGDINKNEKINFTVNWYWNFENQNDLNNTDLQDTKDSKNLSTYQFDILAVGEEF